MIQVKVRSIVLLSIILPVSVGFGLRQLRSSSLFSIQSIEVVWLNKNSGVGIQSIESSEVKKRIQMTLGKAGLFDMDAKEVERGLLSYSEWIRSVKVKRQFPNSLEVWVALRTPEALIQISKDTLRYLDQEGVIFGYPDLKAMKNLPVFTGFLGHPNEIRHAISLMDHWELSGLARVSTVSSLYFDSERGFRVLASYPLKAGVRAGGKGHFGISGVLDNKFRTMIDLGQEIDGRIDQKMAALSAVIKYLSDHSMPVRQIWAEVDKKVVVKTVDGS